MAFRVCFVVCPGNVHPRSPNTLVYFGGPAVVKREQAESAGRYAFGRCGEAKDTGPEGWEAISPLCVLHTCELLFSLPVSCTALDILHSSSFQPSRMIFDWSCITLYSLLIHDFIYILHTARLRLFILHTADTWLLIPHWLIMHDFLFFHSW